MKQKAVTTKGLMAYGENRAGVLYFTVKSQARKLTHHLAVQVSTGRVDCSCEGFQYNFALKRPTLDTTDFHCKHIRTYLNELRRSRAEAQSS